MGEVWLAEQTRPVHRQVALKVIKAGMDTALLVSFGSPAASSRVVEGIFANRASTS